MSNLSKYTPQATSSETNVNFGAFHPDRPSIGPRRQTMPDAWQTRGIAQAANQYKDGYEVRSFRDQMLDPVRWCFSTKYHAVGTAIAGAVLVTVIF